MSSPVPMPDMTIKGRSRADSGIDAGSVWVGGLSTHHVSGVSYWVVSLLVLAIILLIAFVWLRG